MQSTLVHNDLDTGALRPHERSFEVSQVTLRCPSKKKGLEMAHSFWGDTKPFHSSTLLGRLFADYDLHEKREREGTGGNILSGTL